MNAPNSEGSEATVDDAARSEGADERDLKARILTEAARLFAQHGYRGASIRELAEACECTKPAVYYYFRNKEELYRELIDHEIDSVSAMIRELLLTAGSMRARLAAAAVGLMLRMDERPEAMQLLHSVEMRLDAGAPIIDLAPARRLHQSLTEEMIRQGMEAGEVDPSLDPHDCALALAGIISFQLQRKLCGEPANAEQLQRAIEYLFSGIAPRSRSTAPLSTTP